MIRECTHKSPCVTIYEHVELLFNSFLFNPRDLRKVGVDIKCVKVPMEARRG